MKKTILTIATIGLLFTSCTKEDNLQPVVAPVVITQVECLDICGSIIAMKHNYDNTVNITSELTLTTSCDTVEVVRVHTIEEIVFTTGMTVCFDRNELTK
jgi:nitrous oxide reductase accessory protein NosL